VCPAASSSNAIAAVQEKVAADAQRASEIITRIRSMTRNAPPEQLAVDINEVIADVLSFAQGELIAKGVSVRKALFESLPWLLEIAQVGLGGTFEGAGQGQPVGHSARLCSQWPSPTS
jgi:C4-dicarboxylate-specific signal transduction histidine kinase